MPVTPDFHFTRPQIVAAATTNPWKRQEDFAREVKPEDMADTAVRYQRAAAESESAGELARRASETGAAAGALDGASLVDGDGHIRLTTADLDTPGVERVVTGLQKAMNAAVDAAEKVAALVEDGGLDHAISRHEADAAAEWDSCLAQLATRVPDPGTRFVERGDLLAVTVSDAEGPVPIPPVWYGTTFSYELTQQLHDRIRARHLARAAATADRYDADIAEEIEAYRHRLSGYARELSAEGYDIMAGPLDLFANPWMAAYAAAGLADELGADKPDPAKLAEYTAVLAVIRDRVVVPDEKLTSLGDERELVTGALTEQERDYLVAFYGALPAGTLAGFGRDLFEDAAGIGDQRFLARDPGGPTAYDTARDLSNGLLILMNESIGGIDLTDPTTGLLRQRALVPDAVNALAPDPGVAHQAVPRASLDASLDFATLLSTSTVPVGSTFAHRLEALVAETAGHQHDPDSYYGRKYAEWGVSYEGAEDQTYLSGLDRWDTPEQRLARESGGPEYVHREDVPEWGVREGIYGLGHLGHLTLPAHFRFGQEE